MGSILTEIEDEWQVNRRYFSRQSMRKLTEPETERANLERPLRLASVRYRNGYPMARSGDSQLLHLLMRRKHANSRSGASCRLTFSIPQGLVRCQD